MSDRRPCPQQAKARSQLRRARSSCGQGRGVRVEAVRREAPELERFVAALLALATEPTAPDEQAGTAGGLHAR